MEEENGKYQLRSGLAGITQRKGYISALRDMDYVVNETGTSFDPEDLPPIPSDLHPSKSIRYYTYPEEPGMIYWGYVGKRDRDTDNIIPFDNIDSGQNKKENENQDFEVVQYYMPDDMAAITPASNDDILTALTVGFVAIAVIGIVLVPFTYGFSLALVCV